MQYMSHAETPAEALRDIVQEIRRMVEVKTGHAATLVSKTARREAYIEAQALRAMADLLEPMKFEPKTP